jgi:2'-5' RNA ligase
VERSARVFFALWPGEAVRAALHGQGRRLHAELAGRLTRAQSIHMTLLFLGEVPETRLDALHAAATDVPVESFSLHVDRAACWRHNRIAWVGPARTPPALDVLVGQLRDRVADAGFAFDRKPFAPHVTLVRNALCRPLDDAIEPIEWAVQDFVLVRSVPEAGGSNYAVIGRWGRGEDR